MNIHTLADDLDTGRLELWHLPPWAFALWHSGYFARDHEVLQLQQLLEQANADADRYYELWRNPGRSLADVRQRRIEQALAEAASSAVPLTLQRQVEITVQAAIPPRRRAA